MLLKTQLRIFTYSCVFYHPERVRREETARAVIWHPPRKIVKSEKKIAEKGTTFANVFVKIRLKPAVNIAETAVNRKRVRA